MPTPNRPQIRIAIEKALKLVMAASGRECPPITDTTRPVGDFGDFDSLLGLEATVDLERELGCKLADGSAFVIEVAGGKKRSLTVAQAVDRVAAMIIEPRAA
jgi:acyl carrier protein